MTVKEESHLLHVAEVLAKRGPRKTAHSPSGRNALHSARQRGLVSYKVKLVDGRVGWIPSDQIVDLNDGFLDVGDKSFTLKVTRWIAEAKGLV